VGGQRPSAGRAGEDEAKVIDIANSALLLTEEHAIFGL
jgi:hypothetical protein